MENETHRDEEEDAALSDAALSDAALSDAALSDAALSDAALSDAALSDEEASLSDVVEEEDDDDDAPAAFSRAGSVAFRDTLRAADEALYIACAAGDLLAIREAVDAGAAANSATGERAFVQACGRGDASTVKFLLDHGVSAIAVAEPYGLSGLRAACKDGHIEVVKVLLGAGVLQLQADDRALAVASCRGDYDIVELLLAAGARAGGFGHEALCEACRWGHAEVVKLLLASGADPSAREGLPLSIAASRGNLALMDTLLDAGADVHALDDIALRSVCGRPSDHQAAVINRLLEAGANVYARDDEPLLNACVAARDCSDAVKCLLSAGANVHARNGEALVAACRFGRIRVVQMLVDGGANVPAAIGKAALAAIVDPLRLTMPGHLLAELRPSWVEVVICLVRGGVDIADLRWDLFVLHERLHLLFVVRPSQFGALDQDQQVEWLRYVLRPRRRLLNALFRARARLDRPPSQPLGTSKPSREELIAHLRTAGRRFAREYWAEGLPLFFPGLDLGRVPREFRVSK